MFVVATLVGLFYLVFLFCVRIDFTIYQMLQVIVRWLMISFQFWMNCSLGCGCDNSNTSLTVMGALVHHLQQRTTCQIKNG